MQIDEIRFAPNQKLPPGYRVVWRESDEMYCWERGDVEGPACCDRFMARRCAWANYEANRQKQIR